MGVKELRFSPSADFSCLLLNGLISHCEEKGVLLIEEGGGWERGRLGLLHDLLLCHF